MKKRTEQMLGELLIFFVCVCLFVCLFICLFVCLDNVRKGTRHVHRSWEEQVGLHKLFGMVSVQFSLSTLSSEFRGTTFVLKFMSRQK